MISDWKLGGNTDSMVWISLDTLMTSFGANGRWTDQVIGTKIDCQMDMVYGTRIGNRSAYFLSTPLWCKPIIRSGLHCRGL